MLYRVIVTYGGDISDARWIRRDYLASRLAYVAVILNPQIAEVAFDGGADVIDNEFFSRHVVESLWATPVM